MNNAQKSKTPKNKAINTIITELERPYSNQRTLLIPFFKSLMYTLLRGYAIRKCANADSNKNVPYSRFWYPLPLYHFSSPLGCLYCSNRLNVNADLSFGDAWLPEIIKTDSVGSSIVIARTSKALSLLEEAETVGALYLKEISIDDVLRTQAVLEEKSRVSMRRARIRAQFFASSNANSLEVLDALLPIFHATIMRNKNTRGIVCLMPSSLLGIYCRLCGLIHRKSL